MNKQTAADIATVTRICGADPQFLDVVGTQAGLPLASGTPRTRTHRPSKPPTSLRSKAFTALLVLALTVPWLAGAALLLRGFWHLLAAVT